MPLRGIAVRLSVQERLELAAESRRVELEQGTDLDLSHSLDAHAEALRDLRQRVLAVHPEPETHPQDEPLALTELVERSPQAALEGHVLDLGTVGVRRARIDDEVSQPRPLVGSVVGV